KESTQSALEGSADEHGSSIILLHPTLQITMPVSSRASQILADSGISVDHQATSEPGRPLSDVSDRSLQRAAGAKPSMLRTASPCTTAWLIFTTPCTVTRA